MFKKNEIKSAKRTHQNLYTYEPPSQKFWIPPPPPPWTAATLWQLVSAADKKFANSLDPGQTWQNRVNDLDDQNPLSATCLDPYCLRPSDGGRVFESTLLSNKIIFRPWHMILQWQYIIIMSPWVMLIRIYTVFKSAGQLLLSKGRVFESTLLSNKIIFRPMTHNDSTYHFFHLRWCCTLLINADHAEY